MANTRPELPLGSLIFPVAEFILGLTKTATLSGLRLSIYKMWGEWSLPTENV